ncbi:hypothetical protein FE257_005894 [Aspergillus nanangensis]|uniref:HAT C-terminal dimerisation domain-containing protein n=1 Tax=Aspergillus nanangensis TaxID=2582783 RepID=A0AAD4GUC8_ASPNN|nr:hypothetical protein FE257_005894 [Aspergillus nanangensis]
MQTVFDTLFINFDGSVKLLQSKRLAWQRRLQQGLEESRKTVQAYYANAYHSEGMTYAVATVLNPACKLRLFQSHTWTDDETIGLHDISTPLSRSETDPVSYDLSTRYKRWHISRLLNSAPSPEQDELYVYLGENPSDMNIHEYWRVNEQRFPILALMARDFLSIATSGVGVQRLFNSACDVCHDRDGRLYADTVHASILQLCTDRFQVYPDYQVPEYEPAAGTIVDDEDYADDSDDPAFIGEDDEYDDPFQS